jgi:hypothetical protein
VAAVAVAGQPGVVTEPLWRRTARLTGRGDEAAVLAVDHIDAAHECDRPLSRRREQVAQRRHGAVVEVGPAQPQPVERQIGVAVGLHEMLELIPRAGEQLG